MDVMKKKQMLAMLVMLSLLHGSVYAEINEKPEAGEQYDDFLIWGYEVQINEYPTLEKHYYFNKGAQIGGENGGTGNAVLIGQRDTPKVTFHVGKAEGKDYDLTLIGEDSGVKVSENAEFHIDGEGTNIKFGAEQWDEYGEAATIYVDENAVFTVNAANMWSTGGAETNLKLFDNAQATITLTGDFIADAGGTGIANQNFYSDSKTNLTINANNISLSTTDLARAERRAGLYLLAYNNGGNSTMEVNLNAKGNLDISGFSRGVQTFGSSDVDLTGSNVTISALADDNGRGLYLDGYGAEKSTNINIAATNEVNIEASQRAIYATDRVKIENISAKTVNILGGEYGVYATENSSINTLANTLTISADDGWSVRLFSGSKADFKANKTTYNQDIYVKGSEFNAFANKNEVNGQVRVLDGGTANFSSFNDDSAGVTTIKHTTSDAVTATSDEDEISKILFKQATFINSQDDEEYHADKQGERTKSAIRANRNSVITLDKAAGIYGDIIAGRGNESNATGGKITINSVEGAKFKGDVLAGNSGEITLTLNGASYEGRVDDYADASLSNDPNEEDVVFRPKEFDVDVTKGGTVNMTLNKSNWDARGQSFVTELTFENGGSVNLVDVTETDGSGVHGNSVTIRNLKGDGTFNMTLNSADHSLGDMLYIGKNEGKQTINIVGGITGGLENISDDNPLRFATVGIDTVSANPDVNNSGIRAYTRDGGVFDLEYFVDKEGYNPDDINNELYNGYDDGKDGSGNDIDKPGNDFVENALVANGTNAVNWIITGAKEAKQSDAGKTIINMSKVNYNNAIYMDRLNKRLGEARYLNPEEEQGMWVRIRHDRIGKKDAFRSQNTMYEMGYDEKQDCDNGERRVGFAIDYMDGKAEYTGIAGDGDVKRYGLWLYDTWLGDKGHYTDYVAKWGHLENDFDIMARSTGEKITGDYSNNVFSVSAEYGKKNDMGNNWYFEPQAQLQLARVTGADYVTTQGTKVSLDGINSLIGRAGFRLGRDLDENSTVYVKADLLHEFLGEQDIAATDLTGTLRETYENKGTWYDVGFGFATALGKNSYAFMDFEKSFGNDNEETYQINVGMQWSF